LAAEPKQQSENTNRENTMTEFDTARRTDHEDSLGSRISWGAILAGCMTALGMYFLLTTLGAAVGLSISDRTNPSSLQTGAIAWAFVTTAAALFVGGVVTSMLTIGEDRIEAMLHGVIMWAVLFTMLLVLGTAGIHSGFNAMAASASQSGAIQNWERAAQDDGVTLAQIQEWRRQTGAAPRGNATDPEDREAGKAAATRMTWYAFAGTWLSMIAGALGGLVGAGPTFRDVTVRTTSHRVAVSH